MNRFFMIVMALVVLAGCDNRTVYEIAEDNNCPDPANMTAQDLYALEGNCFLITPDGECVGEGIVTCDPRQSLGALGCASKDDFSQGTWMIEPMDGPCEAGLDLNCDGDRFSNCSQ